MPPPTETQLHTDAELARVLQLLERRDARLVTLGHGRDPAARVTAEAFAAAWVRRGGEIDAIVDWPAGATAAGALWRVHDRQLVRHIPINRAAAPSSTLIPRSPVEVIPGAFHIPDWLGLETQREIVAFCCNRARGPAHRTGRQRASVASDRVVAMAFVGPSRP
ncbi:MAG: hypothetical protein ACYDHH_16230 [Solirubrobacteraceae bacterium]